MWSAQNDRVISLTSSPSAKDSGIFEPVHQTSYDVDYEAKIHNEANRGVW